MVTCPIFFDEFNPVNEKGNKLKPRSRQHSATEVAIGPGRPLTKTDTGEDVVIHMIWLLLPNRILRKDADSEVHEMNTKTKRTMQSTDGISYKSTRPKCQKWQPELQAEKRPSRGPLTILTTNENAGRQPFQLREPAPSII